MDKGLITIKELEKKLKDLELKKLDKDTNIAKLNSEKISLDNNINNLENKNYKLKQKKEQNEISKEYRKSQKTDLIIGFVLAYIILSLVVGLATGYFLGNITSVIKSLGVLVLFLTCGAAVVLPIEFKMINKRHSIANLKEVEETLLNNNENIKLLESKRNVIVDEIANLTLERRNIQSKIIEIMNKINSINQLRTIVIEEFCKDNKELDKKLDDAYDNYKVKYKVK